MKTPLAVLLTLFLSAAQQGCTGETPSAEMASGELTPVGRGRVSAIYDVRSDGQYMYALERGVLHVLDASNPAALREVGAVEFARPRVRAALRPPYLYLSGFNEPLGVIDVSQPAQPRFVADLPELGSVANDGVELVGDVAYVVRRELQPDNTAALYLDVLDVATNPRSPTRQGTVELGARVVGEYGGIAYADGKIFIVIARAVGAAPRSTLLLIDARDPAQPRIERTLTFPEGELYRDVEVRGGLVYALQNESPERAAGLAIFRLPESGELELLGAAITPDLRIPIDLVVHEDVVFATFKLGGLVGTFDVTDPRAPRLTSTYRQRDSWAAGLGLDLVDDRLYVAGDNGASAILDVTDPRVPVLLGRYEFEGGSVSRVQVIGDLAVLLSLSNLHFFDVSDPRAPRRAGFYAGIPSHDPEEFEFAMVASSGRRAFVGFDRRPAQLVDFANPARPTLLATFTPRGLVRAALLDAEHATLGFEGRENSGSGGIEFVDVSDGTKPTSLAVLDLGKPVHGLARSSDRIVAAHPDGGLSVLDATDPSRPSVVGTLTGSAAPVGPTHLALSADGTTAYVARPDGEASDSATLLVVDLREATAPRVLAELRFPVSAGYATPLVVRGSRAMILAGADGGVVTVDVSDPEQPRILEVRPLPVGVFAEDLTADDSHLYVAASEDGVLVFQQLGS